MNITITPSTLTGTVTPPPSKSQAHRVLIAAALAEGDSLIRNIARSRDIDATRRCLEELGASFEDTAEGLVVHGMGANTMSPMRRMAYPHLDCGESGSTLRFLIPVALAVRGGGIFTGQGRLMERPLGPYEELFKEKGIFWEQKDGVLTVRGLLEPGEYRLLGNVSSQFFSGLLFALPLIGGPSAIIPTTMLESESYITMTCQAMDDFGVLTAATMSLPPQYHTFGNQTYRANHVTVEADWSQAAFWYAAKSLGNGVETGGLNAASIQGDRAIVDWFVRLSQPGDVDIDVSQCPDLVPALAVMAAVRQGTARIVNAARLRLKESDRLASTAAMLNALGGRAEELPDGLVISGVSSLRGGTVDACNDHRIAMAAAIAATRCNEPVTVLGAECVSKSYPDFWEDYEGLGGKLDRRYHITLEPITPDNWREAVFLSTDPEHKNPLDQEWLCSNAFSMLQAIYEPVCNCRLIRADGKAVGFVMYEAWEMKGKVPLLCRYMIDVDFQGKGYGEQALPVVLEEMYREYGRRELYITVELANQRAVRLYEKFGFHFTGEMDYDEAIFVLPAPDAGEADQRT